MNCKGSGGSALDLCFANRGKAKVCRGGKQPKQIIAPSLLERTEKNIHIQSSTNLFFSVDQNIGNKRFLKF